MELEESSLYREVDAIVRSDSKPVHYTWSAKIHVNGQNYEPFKLLSIDFIQDWEEKYADEILVTLAIAGGTFAKRIYPFKDAVDITLYKTPLREIGDTMDEEGQPESERYTATLIDTGNPLLEANGMNSPSEEALNLTNIFEVKFQLVNKALEQLRMMAVGGIYRAAKVEDIIRAVLTKESQKVTVDGARLPQGVDMVPASNQKPREHVIFPHGIKLVEVPQYIHHKCGGVYNAGLGYYLQGDHWYVYPCYDTSRFNKATNTLTVINVPKNKMPGIERTYRKDGKNLVILATGEVHFRDDSEVQQLNLGNGVRFAAADGFMEGTAVQTKGNKAVADRSKNTTEFISTARKSGNNNVHLSSNPINSNSFVEFSKLARRQGSFLSLVWENSLPSLLYPGMMVKILYMQDEDIIELYGTALKAHHYVQMHGQGKTDTRYVCRTMLAVFVQRLKE